MSVAVNVIDSEAALDIVTKPYLVSDDLQPLAQAASADFITQVVAPSSLPEPIVVLEILRGARYYHLPEAYEQVLGKQVKVVSLRAHRAFDEETKKWSCRVWQADGLEALAQARTVLIGDTIATGTTLCGVVQHVLQEYRPKVDAVGALDKLEICCFTIAGGHRALEALEALAPQLEADYGAVVSVHFANAIFNLAENGTDLGFDAAQYTERAEQEIKQRLGDFAPLMKCAVWDWGERFYAAETHLKDIDAYFSSLDNVPEWLLDGLAAAKAKHASLSS